MGNGGLFGLCYNAPMNPARPAARRLLALAAFLPVGGGALPVDKQQPVHIAATEVTHDTENGVILYRGDVRMEQGGLRIEADAITVYSAEPGGGRVVAESAGDGRRVKAVIPPRREPSAGQGAAGKQAAAAPRRGQNAGRGAAGEPAAAAASRQAQH